MHSETYSCVLRLQDQITEGILVLSDKSEAPVAETKKVVVKSVLDPRAGDWLEPDLAARRGLVDTEKGTYRWAGRRGGAPGRRGGAPGRRGGAPGRGRRVLSEGGRRGVLRRVEGEE